MARRFSTTSSHGSNVSSPPAYDGGDHTIYVGEIEEAQTREGKPLMFFRGGYRALGD